MLLDHPELKKSLGSINGVAAAYLHLELTGDMPINPSDLNTDNGLAGTLMEKLVDQKSHERTRDLDFHDNANARANHAHQKMQDASRLMAGVFVSAGHHELGTTALEKVRMCTELKRQKEVEASQKKEEEEEKLRQKMLAVHQKDEASWNLQDLRTMVSWFKRLGDSKMPSKKEQLLR